MDNTKQKKIKRKGIIHRIRSRFGKEEYTDEEFRIAGEYVMEDTDLITMEKDLLLRGSKYKPAKRIMNASLKLRRMARMPIEEPVNDKKLKGGILDGVRRS